ncbi:HesA/MoeB/ThiF family protein [Haliangium ochraceum]|uniref:UBA/THIF-type NAD/FAD binding protein n=1 Tax=Haliangium ochraceum (strain DSM 14365 / JCM 11303 / SMP-2) TaxID=502025 RepID=D0LKV4_HALO1|nr:HesA/MoeB/ThiF family protein [Haliangium ochraceum]ACY16674.1 UBA/THIF-type NAD/FAD binding protein [Haliangium ochraceum DSM 14365]
MSERLHAAVIGAGGLGGPVAYALAQAGVGLTLCDHDRVELSNLQRQVQFATGDIGARKVDALAAELGRRGAAPGSVRALPLRFDGDSAAEVLAGADIVIDGSDDFATKFAVNDLATRAGLPFVIGSVLRYSGQVFAHDPARQRGCYRCLFEEPPSPDEAGPTCADAGVLGAAVAVIGGYVARAALALLAQRQGRPGAADAPFAGGGLWVFDDVRALERVRRVGFAARASCPACRPQRPEPLSPPEYHAT